jgi:DNA-binding transcriptional regulator YbjK
MKTQLIIKQKDIMGIFDIFFRRKERTFEKANLEDIDEAATKKISEHNENFKQEAANFFSRVRQEQEKMKANLERLSSAEVKEQTDPQLLKVAVTSRKSFVKKFEDLIEHEEKEDFSINSVSEAFNRFYAKLNDVNASTVPEFASIKEVFKNESFAVTDEMKNLKKIYDDFKEKLRKEMDLVQPYEEILNKVKILNEEKEKLENYKKDLENILRKNENLTKENEMMQINLQKLEESSEWNE